MHEYRPHATFLREFAYRNITTELVHFIFDVGEKASRIERMEDGKDVSRKCASNLVGCNVDGDVKGGKRILRREY